MRRRRFLKTVPILGTAFAGCAGTDNNETKDTVTPIETPETTVQVTQTPTPTETPETTVQVTQTPTPVETLEVTETPEEQSPDSREPKFRLREVTYPESLAAGTPLNITIVTENVGAGVGTTSVRLKLLDIQRSTTVELQPGSATTVEFTIEDGLSEGTYDVSIAESETETSATGTITVQPRVLDIPWTQRPGPPGGPVTDIAVSPLDSDYLYATTRTAGLYASSDGGNSWIQGPEARHHEVNIVASPHDSEEARSNFNRTATAGQEWFDQFSPPEKKRIPVVDGSINDVAYDPNDKQILYAMTTAGFRRSVDGGVTWNLVDVEPADADQLLTRVAAPGGQEGVVFISSHYDAAVFRSEDYGQSWTCIVGPEDINGGPARGLIAPDSEAGICYVSVDRQGVYRCGDGEPELVTTELSSPKFLYYDGLTISAEDKRVYFISYDSDGDMWESIQLHAYDTDAGETRPIPMPAKPSSVTAHPTEPERLYFGGWQWVWESTDLGETWTPHDNKFIDRYLSAVSVNPESPGMVIPGSICSSGVWVSQDSGQTFSWKRSGLGPYHEGEHAEHYVLYTRANGNYAYATTRAGLEISTDGGESWRLLDTDFSGNGGRSDPDATPLHGLAVDPSDPQTVYVGAGRIPQGFSRPADFGGSFMWKSTDGGETWRDITAGFPTESDTVIHQLQVSSHDSDRLYVATNAKDKFVPDTADGSMVGEGIGIHVSPDSGETFEKLSTPFSSVFSFAEDPVDPDRLYASTQDGAYRSDDGGGSWTSVLSHKTKALTTHPTKSDVVFAGAQKYPNYWDVLVSTDGGESWAEGNLIIQVGRQPNKREYDGIDLNADYRNDFGYIMELAVDGTNDHLYAATRGAGLWRGSLTSIDL